ncbi:MAG: XTP/dITP diphosphatase [Deltaproteobacteria bacterium]|nr:XTP/dITP diphosphatase [Deltaproteobacteria bacterium]
MNRSFKELALATRNLHKAQELKRMLEGLPLQILTLQDLPEFSMPPEDKPTFRENALQKAVTTAQQTGKFSLADDSGLEVDVLGGEPGVFSARYAGPQATDPENNEKLLKALEGIASEKRTARFRCALALAKPSGDCEVVEGTCEGVIASEPRGTCGFGYDPLFLIPSLGKTFGELGETVKSQISHRAIAARKLRELLQHLAS